MYWNAFRKALRKAHRSSMEEKNRGFIMIYTIFITTLCFILVMGCFKLENLQRINNERHIKNSIKSECYELEREYLFTELDKCIHNEVKDLNSQNLKAYFESKEEFNINHNNCYLKYLKNRDCFLGVYFSKENFYKEELYSYKINKQCVLYECSKYSFKEGELEK